MQSSNILTIQRVSAEDRARIEAVDPAIQLIDAGGWYDGEIRETWPAFISTRYLPPNAMGSGTREAKCRRLATRLLDGRNSSQPFWPSSTSKRTNSELRGAHACCDLRRWRDRRMHGLFSESPRDLM